MQSNEKSPPTKLAENLSSECQTVNKKINIRSIYSKNQIVWGQSLVRIRRNYELKNILWKFLL